MKKPAKKTKTAQQFPKVGVVVLAHNAAEYIGECLSSLLANDYPNFELVLVDDVSTDRTVFIVHENFPSVQVIKNAQPSGFGESNNKAVRYFFNERGCDLVMLINDDTVVDQELITELVKPFHEDPEIGCTGPIMTYFDDPERIWFAGGYFNEIFCYTRHPWMNKTLNEVNLKDGETDFITACCQMFKKEVFETIGYLDEGYGQYFLDSFFCVNAGRAGFKSYLVAKPMLRHRVSASLGRSGSNRLTPFRAYYYARNPFFFLKDDTTGWRRLTGLIGQLMIRFPFYAKQMLLNQDWRTFRAYLKGFKDGLQYFAGSS